MILVCGEALYDVFPDGSEQAGGSPCNVAIGLARLGVPAALATAISADQRGRALSAALELEGVDGRFLRRSAGPTPLARVELDPAGTPHYCFEGLADAPLHPEPPLPPDISCFHTGSYALVSPRSGAALREIFDQAPSSLLLSLDPNVRLAMEPSAAAWRAAVSALASRADLIKMSEEDLACLAGAETDPEAVAGRWLGGRCSLMAVTRGSRGATVFTRRHGRIDVAGEPVEMVDSVGAGDAFQAAMLGWLHRNALCSPTAVRDLEPGQLRRLLESATRAGGLACTRRGPNPPTAAELDFGL
ncbi:MAG TPA: carbohydrate kinase [Allosphingosinicella sp.]|nr:carbohydrate kinase [Allosphingosinicella sp.]